MENLIKEGAKVYYTEGNFYGTIIKVLKRDCRILRYDGANVNRQISMIKQMVIK